MKLSVDDEVAIPDVRSAAERSRKPRRKRIVVDEDVTVLVRGGCEMSVATSATWKTIRHYINYRRLTKDAVRTVQSRTGTEQQCLRSHARRTIHAPCQPVEQARVDVRRTLGA